MPGSKSSPPSPPPCRAAARLGKVARSGLFCTNTHSAGTPRSKRPAARAGRARVSPCGPSTAGHRKTHCTPRRGGLCKVAWTARCAAITHRLRCGGLESLGWPKRGIKSLLLLSTSMRCSSEAFSPGCTTSAHQTFRAWPSVAS